MRRILIKATASIILGVGSIGFLGSLFLGVYIWFYYSGSPVIKKVLFDLGILILGLIFFVFCLGLAEFFFEFLKVEKEIEEIEEEVEDIGKRIK